MPKKAIVIMAAIAFIFTALVGGGFYMMWLKIASLQPPEEVLEEEEVETEDPPQLGEMFPLETFVVNLADANGQRYLRVTMQLELAPGVPAATMEQRLPLIRDVALTILPTKSFDEIRTVDGKSALRGEIMDRLNTLLYEEGIVNIYFTEFVIQ
jgi:flagellar FliL protein